MESRENVGLRRLVQIWYVDMVCSGAVVYFSQGGTLLIMEFTASLYSFRKTLRKNSRTSGRP